MMLVAKQAPLAHKLNTPWRVSFESPSAETPLPASPEEKPGSSQRQLVFQRGVKGDRLTEGANNVQPLLRGV